MESLYHIHRKGNNDSIWKANSRIVIDDTFQSIFYQKLLEEDKALIDRYGDYDIDFIIAIMEEMKFKDQVAPDFLPKFDKLLNCFYFLRREKALEEGRLIFAPDVPSRVHSVFLSDSSDLAYWANLVGDNSYDIFEVNADGNLFVSSDIFFPEQNLLFDLQVEKSREYWQPKIKELNRRREYVFQGTIDLIKRK